MALAQKKKKRTERKRRILRPAQPQPLDTRAILARIDEMLRELEKIRQQLAPQPPPSNPTPNLVEQLFGALGHGTWDEYDPYLEWERFGE